MEVVSVVNLQVTFSLKLFVEFHVLSSRFALNLLQIKLNRFSPVLV